jgi:CRISPR-associated protein Cas2
MKRNTTINQNRCYIIAYDIPDDRRRFECFLSKKDFVQLKGKLASHLDCKSDSVRFYPLCANCLEIVETVGGEPPKDDVLFVV